MWIEDQGWQCGLWMEAFLRNTQLWQTEKNKFWSQELVLCNRVIYGYHWAFSPWSMYQSPQMSPTQTQDWGEHTSYVRSNCTEERGWSRPIGWWQHQPTKLLMEKNSILNAQWRFCIKRTHNTLFLQWSQLLRCTGEKFITFAPVPTDAIVNCNLQEPHFVPSAALKPWVPLYSCNYAKNKEIQLGYERKFTVLHHKNNNNNKFYRKNFCSCTKKKKKKS